MKTIKKVVIILIILFIVRNISNCRCPDNVIFFDFREMIISGIYPYSDTISKSSVAFKVSLLPDKKLFSSSSMNSHYFGFSNAYATSCDQEYQTNSRIEEIKIKTIYRLSENIGKNSDVTDLFLTDKNNDYLYITIDEIYGEINQTSYFKPPEQNFNLFLKNEVLNDSAQFIINIKFSDNYILSDTTKLFFIMK